MDVLRHAGIYEIRNTVNGKRYIGSTVNFKRRWWAHRAKLSEAHKGKHPTPEAVAKQIASLRATLARKREARAQCSI